MRERRSVLVVDDDDDVLTVLEALLDAEGYEVWPASDGEQALALLEDIPTPGLILLDLILPNVDGWEFCERRRDDPLLSWIPVVAFTEPACRPPPVDVQAVLPKPLRIQMLLEIARRTARVVPEA